MTGFSWTAERIFERYDVTFAQAQAIERRLIRRAEEERYLEALMGLEPDDYRYRHPGGL